MNKEYCLLGICFGLALASAANAACPSSNANRFRFESFTYTSGGQSDAANNVVVDGLTGVKWRRCAEGQLWNGSACSGTAGKFSHEQALTRAQGLAGWRLPGVRETIFMVDRQCQNLKIDPRAFPGVFGTQLGDAGTVWSATPAFAAASLNDAAFAVDFNTGGSQGVARTSLNNLLLVRDLP